MPLFCESVLVGILLAVVNVVPNTDHEVELVTMLFRHGDRTPDVNDIYPRDPYINSTYYPIGLGQLTNKGKQREFALGGLIRERYSKFLGETYFPGDVDAISTNQDRTKASLELVLAGAFPPTDTALQWNATLNWNPIPYNYLSYEIDLWLTESLYFCPKYAQLHEQYLLSPEGEKLVKENEELFEFVSSNTGLNVTDPLDLRGVYSCLQSQEEWGYPLPQWTEGVYPDLLEKVSVEALRTLIATTEMKQLSGGFLLKRIIDNMNAKVEGRLEPNNRKLFLYSAHDTNILYMSGVLNQPVRSTVPYGSYYIIELVKINNSHYVQVYANDYVTQEITQINIPGCTFQCPLQKFSKLLEKNVANDEKACGVDPKHNEKYEQKRSYYLGKLIHKKLIDHFTKLSERSDKLYSNSRFVKFIRKA